jgi:hypothetical protein
MDTQRTRTFLSQQATGHCRMRLTNTPHPLSRATCAAGRETAREAASCARTGPSLMSNCRHRGLHSVP